MVYTSNPIIPSPDIIFLSPGYFASPIIRIVNRHRAQSFRALSRSALPTTLTELKAIAAAAKMGLSRIPKTG